MNSILSRNVVELLDRKYSFVQNNSEEMFLLDLEQFMTFLHLNELIRPFSQKLLNELGKRQEEYKKQLSELESKSV